MEQVASSVGVTRSAVSQWESGKIANLRTGYLPNLAATLGVDLGALVEAISKVVVAELPVSGSLKDDGLSMEEKKLVTCFRQVDDMLKPYILNMVTSFMTDLDGTPKNPKRRITRKD